jgi:hypothetical protein
MFLHHSNSFLIKCDEFAAVSYTGEPQHMLPVFYWQFYTLYLVRVSCKMFSQLLYMLLKITSFFRWLLKIKKSWIFLFIGRFEVVCNISFLSCVWLHPTCSGLQFICWSKSGTRVFVSASYLRRVYRVTFMNFQFSGSDFAVMLEEFTFYRITVELKMA